MSKSVHGHEVLEFMMETGGGFTKDGLRDAIVGRFGADARFYTCSAQGMTAEELIEFLDARGKFANAGEGFNTRPEFMCSHGHHDHDH